MKKLILTTIFVLFSISLVFAATDRVRVQVQYRKAFWVCPKCGSEEITDLNVGTPSTYEHTCKNGHWSNSFKEYNGTASYSQADYDKLTEEVLTTEKDTRVADWIYQIKNPPAYVEPTKAELEAQKLDLENQITTIQGKIDEKTAVTP